MSELQVDFQAAAAQGAAGAAAALIALGFFILWRVHAQRHARTISTAFAKTFMAGAAHAMRERAQSMGQVLPEPLRLLGPLRAATHAAAFSALQAARPFSRPALAADLRLGALIAARMLEQVARAGLDPRESEERFQKEIENRFSDVPRRAAIRAAFAPVFECVRIDVELSGMITPPVVYSLIAESVEEARSRAEAEIALSQARAQIAHLQTSSEHQGATEAQPAAIALFLDWADAHNGGDQETAMALYPRLLAAMEAERANPDLAPAREAISKVRAQMGDRWPYGPIPQNAA